MRMLAALALSVFLPADPDVARAAAPDDQATAVVAALVQHASAVRAYRTDVTMHVHMHSFPYVRITFHGTAEYTYPGHFSATFHGPRKLADGYQRAFNAVGDPATWAQHYTIQVDEATPQPAPGLVVLRLIPHDDASIDHTLAYVDTKALTVQEYAWYYRDGGRIRMKQTFAPVEGVPMASRQDIDIDMKSVRVSMQAELTHYVLQLDPSAESQVTLAPHTERR